MRYVFVNLKRFDIPTQRNGINSMYEPKEWGSSIARDIEENTKQFNDAFKVVLFMPEAHILPAIGALKTQNVGIGCQTVYRSDVAANGNFGAFTGSLTATAASALGCGWAMVGHSEERRDKEQLLGPDCGAELEAIINQEVRNAQAAGMNVVLCVGEKEGVADRCAVIREQVLQDTKGVDLSRLVIAYEPIWAIGFGKPVPAPEYIEQTLSFIKSCADVPTIYGGGLKKENVAQIGAMPSVDGGLVGLTRFAGNPGFYPDEFAEILDLYAQTITQTVNA